VVFFSAAPCIVLKCPLLNVFQCLLYQLDTTDIMKTLSVFYDG